MHYHLEIVMPPTDHVKAAVEKILEPFNEQPDSSDEDHDTRHAFWDFWVIGGRWAGAKWKQSLDQAKLNEFYEWLQQEGVTVSGFTAGKQELSPDSQIPKVDAKWNELFPTGRKVACPIFKHSNDQYSSEDTLQGDIQRLADVPDGLQCEHVIFAGPNYKGELRAVFMLRDTAWNGCNHMPVDWDKTLAGALQKRLADIKHATPEHKAKHTPQADWLVVTVDYHS